MPGQPSLREGRRIEAKPRAGLWLGSRRTSTSSVRFFDRLRTNAI